MGRAIRYSYDFARELFAPVVAFAGVVSDPFKWPHALGIAAPRLDWIFPSEWRQGFCFAFVVIYFFIWYYRKRSIFDNHQLIVPDMPLHAVCQYLMKDSKWAEQLPVENDTALPYAVEHELRAKVAEGRLNAFARFRPNGGQAGFGLIKMPAEEFDKGSWHRAYMIDEEPLTGMSVPAGVYQRITFSRDQVQAIWPRRRWWSLKSTPVSRMDKDSARSGGFSLVDAFKEQDRRYGYAPDAFMTIWGN